MALLLILGDLVWLALSPRTFFVALVLTAIIVLFGPLLWRAFWFVVHAVLVALIVAIAIVKRIWQAV